MKHRTSTALTVANPWSLVPSLGNLDAYISAVNRLPMLTQPEEVSLARAVELIDARAAMGGGKKKRGAKKATAKKKATKKTAAKKTTTKKKAAAKKAD